MKLTLATHGYNKLSLSSSYWPLVFITWLAKCRCGVGLATLRVASGDEGPNSRSADLRIWLSPLPGPANRAHKAGTL